MTYARDIEQLQQNACMWWPQHLGEANASISVIPKLVETQDEFLSILCLSKDNPLRVFDILAASGFPVNLFLKHLCVLADYGGEPIQRLGRSFSDLFMTEGGNHEISFFWDTNTYNYTFKVLPVKGLGNKKLFIDGVGLATPKGISDLYRDIIVLLLFGSTSNASSYAALSSCEIGTLLGKSEQLKKYVRQRYILVSRITGGATANSLGQLAQTEIVDYLSSALGDEYLVVSNGSIQLSGYDKRSGMPFDIVVERDGNKVGIEVSFQVTTNSTIERKAGQSVDRYTLMKNDGHGIAYVIDGAGNFQRCSAVSTICGNSDCTVAYSDAEFAVLAEWIREVL